MDVRHFWDDLPEKIPSGNSVAIDTETLGLNHARDRLCLVQLSWGDGVSYLVQIQPEVQEAPHLKALLANPEIEKIFHFARFDVAILYRTFGILCPTLYCTKIASRLARTYTDRHGLKDLCKELLGIEISKTEQTSDWGSLKLTEDQKKYASKDVLYLHAIRKKLDAILEREGRLELAQRCFSFLPHRAVLDCAGWPEDIFSHNI